MFSLRLQITSNYPSKKRLYLISKTLARGGKAHVCMVEALTIWLPIAIVIELTNETRKFKALKRYEVYF